MQMAHSDRSMRLACVLADGMGGLRGGGVASRIATDALLSSLQVSLLQASDKQWRDRAFGRTTFCSAFYHAAACLAELSEGDTDFSKMATTVAMTIHVGSSVFICHCGDTRVYVYEDDLTLLTKDHSAAWGLVESGAVTLSELRHVGTRSMLTRFLDREGADFEISSRSTGDESAYLLATDGFWELFESEELAKLMRPLRNPDGEPQRVADILQREARRREPEDNATFILLCPMRDTSQERGAYPYLKEFPAFSHADEEA